MMYGYVTVLLIYVVSSELYLYMLDVFLADILVSRTYKKLFWLYISPYPHMDTTCFDGI